MVVPPNGGGATSTAGRYSPSAGPPSVGAHKTKNTTESANGTLNDQAAGSHSGIPLSARRADPLDLSTVERKTPANLRDEKPRDNRPFGIPNAPTYQPTEEEWRDPMDYIRKIAPEASQYGATKIIPPKSWQPPFAIKTQNFHFQTRRQVLNLVEGGSRVNSDYLDQLAKFHKQNGHNLNRFPSVDKRPLDMYRLKKTVERKGGFEQVCKSKRWAEVGRDLGYSGKIMSSLSTSLKNSYQKWVLPYEEYLRVAKPGVQQQLEMMNGGPYTPSSGPSPAKKSQTSTPQNLREHAPAMQASFALQATVNGAGTHQQSSLEPSPSRPPQPPTAGGFTPVNPSGFTAVNAVPPTNSFTSVNNANGFHASHTLAPHQSVNNSPSIHGNHQTTPHVNGNGVLKRQHEELTPDDSENADRKSKRLRKDASAAAGSNMHTSRMSTARSEHRGDSSDICKSCGKPDEPEKLILCETCESPYHMYCLEPPLKQAPDFEWHCPQCLVGTHGYGFEEGSVWSLTAFKKMADEFRADILRNIPHQSNAARDAKKRPSEYDIEMELWRLMKDPSNTVEVEYGADIHSTTHGSGFPTIERHPRDPYSVDPWNLNILPFDQKSLFRYTKSDISGMTVPWDYVGQLYATFCWHTEDHFTYSANYQHFGDTKTWYVVPAEDSYKFEQAMRDEVPELFETQPDLLFQLVTLVSPEKLRNAGVRVYAIDQRAGEFVITFPRAYHAGFNHGFNFNEAVNFAPHDWEPFGAEAVKRLRDYRKQPCFSHDELLLTAASRDQTIRTAKWLAPALERMRDDELEARKGFLHAPEPPPATESTDTYLGLRYKAGADIIDPDTEEDEVICTFCKSYCFLSRYLCKKTGKVLCLLHAGGYECCDAVETERYSGNNGEHVLCYRMSDTVLNTTVRKVVERANTPETWATKVDNELDDNPSPSLKHLRTLLAEGEKIQYELPQLPELRRFVERCNEWVEEATNYITRKQTNRRKNDKAWRKSSAKAAEIEERDKELRSVAKIQDLLATADQIGFDCSEITTLRERASNIAEFQSDANEALNNIHSKSTSDFEELVERGKDFHVDIPEIESLEKVLQRLKWNDLARQKRPNTETGLQEETLADIAKFIQQGLDIGVPESNPDLTFFREHKAQGEVWEEKAKELMAVEQIHYQQLDALSAQAANLPVKKETLAAVEAILKKQREVSDRIVILVDRSRDPDFRNRPFYREMKEVMDMLEELQSKPPGTMDLEKESKRHEDWMRRGKKLFGKANAPLHILHQHMMLVDKRNESCFDLSDQPRGPVEPSSRAATPEEGAAITEGSSSSRDVFCICRKPEAGMMIECELCHEWYHGKCLKIARGKVKEDDKYTCPVCDWRVKIPRDAARPKLEDLQAWQDEIETLPFQPEEEKTLANICDNGQSFRDFIKPYVEPSMPATSDEVGVLRFYLRKIEGADILLAPETNYLRRELHKFAPVAPVEPPTIDVSMSTRKPRPTKQQKLMAQLGITNPEELPQQFKMKPHVAKRKASEALGKTQPHLQPAEESASPTGSRPPEPPSSSGSAQPFPKQTKPSRKHLTALALHVLGPLAGAPVVDQFLAGEPHANREKLLKLKAVLSEGDPTTIGDLEKFKAAVNAQPTPASHAPSFSYEVTPDRNAISSTFRDAPLFSTASPKPMNATSASQPPRLGSPAHFSPRQYSQPENSPPPPSFGSNVFDNASHNIFGSPTMTSPEENKPTVTTPDLGISASSIPSGMPSGMFDSPRPSDSAHAGQNAFSTNAGFNSPGFGGSQQSAGINMDSVFADLVHDDHDPIGGLDGTNEGKDDDGPSFEDTDAAVAETTEDMDMPTAESVSPASDGENNDVDMKDTASAPSSPTADPELNAAEKEEDPA